MKRKGICFVCGCTQGDGCKEGCSWANVKQTICTACSPLSASERLAKRDASLKSLHERFELLTDLALSLKDRMRVLDP